MKKIIYLFFACALLVCLTGCDFFNFIDKDTTSKKTNITIGYVIGEKITYKIYDSYDDITFMELETETGYELLGWSFTKNGDVITKEDLKDKTQVNVYPIIGLKNYRINYDLDGGINNNSNPLTYTIEDEFTIKAPTKTNYAFTGWTTDTITTPVLEYKITLGSYGDLNLKANYEHGKVNVIFNYEGIEMQTIDYNTCCTKPEDPTKMFDTFVCWCTDDSLEEEFDFSKPVLESITLYPKWASTVFYTLTITNNDLIKSNYETGKQLPKDAVIDLTTDYLVNGYAFKGWYVNGEYITNYYALEVSMPEGNLLIEPLFETVENYTYTLGSKTNLQTNITKEGNGELYGEGIGSDYGHSSNKLYLKYSTLEKLTPGVHSFVYEYRLMFNVYVIQSATKVPDITIDYDINYPYATILFNEVEGVSYSYALDEEDFVDCHSGDTFDIGDKFSEHNIMLRAGSAIRTFAIEELPAQAQTYATKTFKYQGDVYDHYIDSMDDLRILLEYYAYSVYPSAGGTSYPFDFYYPNAINMSAAEDYEYVIKRLISVPYDLQYSFTQGSKVVNFELKSDGLFNSLNTTQVKEDVTTTIFMPSTRNESTQLYVDKCSKTQEVKTIYELEALNLGVKPIITDTKTLELYNKARYVLYTYVDDSMTEFEKCKAIYDYLASYVTYDDALLVLEGKKSDYSSFTSYAALVRGIAVCDGISSAYKLLCTLEGIECIEVVGAAKGGGHAWNKVKIAGAWYGVDATWARLEITDTGVYITHNYFLIDELTLMTFGSSRHFEQAEVVGTNTYSYINVVNTANNKLSYFDLISYGDFDLVCTSVIEFRGMVDYFRTIGLNFVEIKLVGLEYSDVSGYSGFYYSTCNPGNNLIYLVR